MKSIPLGALTRVPIRRGFIAINVRIILIIIRIPHTHGDTVADKSSHPAGMRIIGGTDPRELTVIAVLVTIYLFPFTIRVIGQRIIDRRVSLKGPERKTIGK